MYIDTHTHIMDKKYASVQEIVDRFDEDEIEFVNAVGADMPSSREAVRLAAAFDRVYAVVGVHPHDADSYTEEAERELEQLASKPKVVAVGEIGLDYHYDLSPRAVQREVFKRQLLLAHRLHKPVVLHVRDAYADALTILQEHSQILHGGVMHCYSGSPEMADMFLKLGLYLSYSGAVTFQNNKKADECILRTPLSRVLTETDCPYLAPSPHRGEVNYPAYVKFVAEKLASVYGIPVSELNGCVRRNFAALFGI